MPYACTHTIADFTCTDHRGRQYGACQACRASLTRAHGQTSWTPCTRSQTARVALGASRAVVSLVVLHQSMALLARMSPRPPRGATPEQRRAYLERYQQLNNGTDLADSRQAQNYVVYLVGELWCVLGV